MEIKRVTEISHLPNDTEQPHEINNGVLQELNRTETLCGLVSNTASKTLFRQSVTKPETFRSTQVPGGVDPSALAQKEDYNLFPKSRNVDFLPNPKL